MHSTPVTSPLCQLVCLGSQASRCQDSRVDAPGGAGIAAALNSSNHQHMSCAHICCCTSDAATADNCLIYVLLRAYDPTNTDDRRVLQA